MSISLPLALANGLTDNKSGFSLNISSKILLFCKYNRLTKQTMSFVKIWIHLVFATKNREPLLKNKFRYDVYKHIAENCLEKDIFLQAINGYTDHTHCLISLGKDQNIAKISQLIKGESSFWINSNNLLPEKFSWQDDYFAVSVSESQVLTVTNYIKNQEQHHLKKSFNDEVEEFMIKYGWQAIKQETP